MIVRISVAPACPKFALSDVILLRKVKESMVYNQNQVETEDYYRRCIGSSIKFRLYGNVHLNVCS